MVVVVVVMEGRTLMHRNRISARFSLVMSDFCGEFGDIVGGRGV